MENTNSVQPERSMDLFANGVEVNRTDRAGVRLTMLKSIASDEAGALAYLLRQPGRSSPGSGEQSHVAGLNAGAVRTPGQVRRQFLLKHLENHQIALVPEIVEICLGAPIEGFKQSIHKIELGAPQRTPNALQRIDH
jgi:hypothetical protein